MHVLSRSCVAADSQLRAGCSLKRTSTYSRGIDALDELSCVGISV